MFHRARGFHAGHAALALDGGGQRAALTADERARAARYMQRKAKLRAENVLTEKADLLRLCNCAAKTLHRERILRADVDIAFAGAASESRDHHAFQHTVRVAFHDASVHKRAGIALVSVANDVLHWLRLATHLRPFASRRKPAAAAPAQITFRDFVDDVVRRAVKQRGFKSAIAAKTEILTDAGRVDLPAVFQHETSLFLIKRNLVLFGIGRSILRKRKPLDALAAENGTLHDFFTVFQLGLCVKPALRLDAHQRPHLAETVAAALLQANAFAVRLVRKLHRNGNVLLRQQRFEPLEDLHRPAGNATRTRTDKDAAGFQLQRTRASTAQRLQFASIAQFTHAPASSLSAAN